MPDTHAVVHVKGILRCALVTETSETFQTAEIDQLGLLANLQALISLSTDISEFVVRFVFWHALAVALVCGAVSLPFLLLVLFLPSPQPYSKDSHHRNEMLGFCVHACASEAGLLVEMFGALEPTLMRSFVASQRGKLLSSAHSCFPSSCAMKKYGSLGLPLV